MSNWLVAKTRFYNRLLLRIHMCIMGSILNSLTQYIVETYSTEWPLRRLNCPASALKTQKRHALSSESIGPLEEMEVYR